MFNMDFIKRTTERILNESDVTESTTPVVVSRELKRLRLKQSNVYRKLTNR